jgi:predicted permease
LWARFKALDVNPADLENDIEELAQHLESAEAEFLARGISTAATRSHLIDQVNDEMLIAMIARRAPAPRQPALGVDMSDPPNRLRHPGIADRFSQVSRDVRFGLRTLLRERAFTVFVIVTLALGIGANAAMFGVLDRLLLRGPLHVTEARQLRRVVSTTHPADQPAQRTGYLTYAQYQAFRADTHTFAGVAAYNLLTGNMYGVRGAARPIHRGSATGNFFALLGVRPALGRFFTEREDDPDDPQRVVVLGYGFWQSEFGGDSGILGRVVALDYATYTVIGVAPKGFTGIDLARVDAWVPESGVPHSTNWRTIWYWPWLQVVVRIRPGISTTQANEALTRLHRHGYTGRSDVARNATLTAEPVHYTYAGVEGTEARVSRWLLGVSAAVLLIACANVVNLLLARTVRRRRELAVRLALGASRVRIVRLLVIEALLLVTVGATAGVGVAYALGQAARALIPDIDWPISPVDARVLWVTAGVALLAAVLVSVVPARQGSAANPGDVLKSGSREGGGRSSWFRSALMVTQAAMSVVLLVGAGLFAKSFHRTKTLDLGIDTDRLITFRLDHMASAFTPNDTAAMRREVARRRAFYPMVAERLRAWPDIEAVALSASVPFVRVDEYPIRLPGRDTIPPLRGGGPFVAAVSAHYFSTVRTPILHGRDLSVNDRAGNAPVAIINESGARALWPSQNALGNCVIVSDADSCATVVGIAADTRRSSLRDEPAIQVYVPRDQQPIGDEPRVVVRARGSVGGMVSRVREELLRLDPRILYVYVDLPQDEVSTQARPWRLGAAIFTLFGALALSVAAVGLYSVMSYLVTQRTHEIGVRMALGAQPRAIVWMALSNGLTLAGVGMIVGLPLALAGSRGLGPLLFDTPPADPMVYATVICAMTLVAVAAGLFPALRARRVDPMEALRFE